jgi:hypothetical protein
MDYDDFETHMTQTYPRYFGEDKHYGGFAIGAGWYHIIENLMGEIHRYTKWRRNMRAYDLQLNRAQEKGRDDLIKFLSKGRTPTSFDEDRADDILATGGYKIPTRKVKWVQVEQIKEKFGGLRFYYQGGDAHIAGLVSMAESWASNTCETCGNKGKVRHGGWVRTLCDAHEAEHQERIQKMKSEDGDE